MRQLVFEWEDGAALGLELHPHLTVVAGMNAAEREALADELLGAMSGRRHGVRAELEGVESEDVPAVLHRLGLDRPDGLRVARFSPDDVTVDRCADEAISALATVDQNQLWSAAERVVWADARAANAPAAAPAASSRDAEMVERVEARHAAYEAAAERFETVRRAAFYLSGFCALVTLPAVLAVGLPGLGFAVAALLGAVASFRAWRRLVRSEDAEQSALNIAGLRSYLDLSVEQHSSVVNEEGVRRLSGTESRRTALATWRRLAGDVDVAWAIEHRVEIETAATLRRRIGTMDNFSCEDGAIETDAGDVDDEVVHALVRRMVEARNHGGEGVPLVLVEPFEHIDNRVIPFVLELLSTADGHPQLIVLTGDENVASWARLEALTGDVAVIEPHGAPAEGSADRLSA